MIIGTAGHVDHGKSALVEALTGQQMDPLAEERRRGITLDLHVARLALPDGTVAGIVDVPGHEDLVRTMVAGAAGIDLVLLVVAADEGIMAQTREHLAVIEQLRIGRGIPVISRADLVEPQALDQVARQLGEWLGESPVAFGPPIATSARDGRGLPQLMARIAEEARGPASRREDDMARMPVDRSFAVPGVGTVVTGTVWSGAFRVGDAVRLLPLDLLARVRSVERFGSPEEAGLAGERIALGLAGVDHTAVRRGETVVRSDDPWLVAHALDVAVDILPDAPRPLAPGARVRVHLGTAELMARVRTAEAVPPGGTGLARLVLESPLVARAGDRLVLRSYSPVAVIGGGVVLDPDPPRAFRDLSAALAAADLRERLEAVLARRPRGVAESELPVLLGLSPAAVPAVLEAARCLRRDGAVISEAVVRQAMAAAMALLGAFHRATPDEPGMPIETLRRRPALRGVAGAEALDRLRASGDLVVEGSRVRSGAFRRSALVGELTERLVARLEEAGCTPPSTDELEAEFGARALAGALRDALAAGRLVPVQRGRYYGRGPLERFVADLARVAAAGPFTPAALRDATGISRKYLIPLLEWADREGYTRREGEGRVAGPRLGVPAAGGRRG